MFEVAVWILAESVCEVVGGSLFWALVAFLVEMVGEALIGFLF